MKKKKIESNRPAVKTGATLHSLVKELETGGRISFSKDQNMNTSVLIQTASRILKRKRFTICRVDFKGSKDSNEFFERIHSAYYSGFFSRESDLKKYKSRELEKMMGFYEQLKRPSNVSIIQPSLSVFNFSETNWSTTIDLVDNLGKQFKKKTVVFFENFDALSHFKDSMNLQECLRAHFQNHVQVSYCFMVSSLKKEMEIFYSNKTPFYLSARRLAT